VTLQSIQTLVVQLLQWQGRRHRTTAAATHFRAAKWHWRTGDLPLCRAPSRTTSRADPKRCRGSSR